MLIAMHLILSVAYRSNCCETSTILYKSTLNRHSHDDADAADRKRDTAKKRLVKFTVA